MGNRGITPLISNLGSRRGVNFTTRPLYPRERTTVPSAQETGRTQSPGLEVLKKRKKKSLATAGIRTPEPPAGSLVTIQTRLLWFLTHFILLIYVWVGCVEGRADVNFEIGHSETVCST